MIKPLISHASGEHSFSQEFEDRLSNSLFEEFNTLESLKFRTIVDIGASDGTTLSNSRFFVELGFQSLLVDADRHRFKALRQNSSEFTNCYVSNEYVTSENVSELLNLAQIILIGILTIDIDGLDLYILRKFLPYDPKIVVIEYNPTIPLHVSFEQKIGQINLGNSALAVYELMTSVGYFLRYATQTNLIFSKIRAPHNLELKDVLDDGETVRGIWVGYDGSVNFEGRQFIEFPWHGLDQRIRISGIPSLFREFFGGGNDENFKAKSWLHFKKLVNFRDRVISRIDQI
jgi:hypothetical protein